MVLTSLLTGPAPARRRLLRTVGLGLTAAAFLTGCGLLGSDAEERAVGTFVDNVVDPGGQAVVVRLPTAEVVMTIGAPRREITTPEGVLGVPDGAAWIGIGWQTDTRAAPEAMRADGSGPYPRAHVELEIEDRTYDLDEVLLTDSGVAALGDDYLAPITGLGGVYLAAADAGSDLDVELGRTDWRLTVEFDGETQEFTALNPFADVSASSPAATLHRDSDRQAQTERECGRPVVTGAAADRTSLGLAPPTCRLTSATVPWLRGRGWVSDVDGGWFSARLYLSLPSGARVGRSLCGSYARDVDLSAAVTATLDGVPVELQPLDGERVSGPTGTFTVVALTSADGPGTLIIETVQRGDDDDPGCPAQLSLRWEVAL